jgi:hypothetical protein
VPPPSFLFSYTHSSGGICFSCLFDVHLNLVSPRKNAGNEPESRVTWPKPDPSVTTQKDRSTSVRMIERKN